MTKDAVFTMKLEPELRDAFMAAAAARHVPASQLVRGWIRDFVKEKEDTASYHEYLARKVARGREDIEAGRYSTHEEVKAKFAAIRAEIETRT